MRQILIFILLSILSMGATAQSVERTFLGCALGETTWEQAQQILKRKSLEFDADSENSAIFVGKTSFYGERCEPTLFFHKGTFYQVAFVFGGDVTDRLRAKLFEDYPLWPKMGGGSMFFDLDTRILFGGDGGTKLFYTDLKINSEIKAEEEGTKTEEDEVLQAHGIIGRTFVGCTLGETTWEESLSLLRQNDIKFRAIPQVGAINVNDDDITMEGEKCTVTLRFHKGLLCEATFYFKQTNYKRLVSACIEKYGSCLFSRDDNCTLASFKDDATEIIIADKFISFWDRKLYKEKHGLK